MSDTEDELLVPMWSATGRCLEPLVQVQNREQDLLVTVDLPCVENKDDVVLQVTEDSLEVSASFKKVVRWERLGLLKRKVEFQSFRRVVPLPEKVQLEGATASFKRGILQVTLPKAARRYQINID